MVSADFVRTGGMDWPNHALASFLARRGDRVHVAGFSASGDLLVLPNVTYHPVGKPFDSYSLGNRLLRVRGRKLAQEVAARGGRVLVNGGNCDWGDINWIHHVNARDRPPPSGRLLRRLKAALDHRIYVREERAVIPKADVLLVSSEHTRDTLLEELPALSRKSTHVVYPGIDALLFRPGSPDERAETRERFGWRLDRPKVCFVGALGNRRKGFDTLFTAWELLCARSDWDADLVVVGGGAELPFWRRRASEAGLAARFQFLGPRRDVHHILRSSDAHVLPSRYEGYSMVTQEAICCGLPAFVSERAGIAARFPRTLNELLLPDPDDAAELAARLYRWREGLGREWPALASFSDELRRYGWDDMAERIARIIDRGRSG